MHVGSLGRHSSNSDHSVSLRQGFSLAWKPQGFTYVCILSGRINAVHYHTQAIVHGFWDRIQDPMLSGNALCPIGLFPGPVRQP